MSRLRPGWLVALCAAIVAVSAWLPWLTTRADGGGRANAIGGIVGEVGGLRDRLSGFGVGQLIVLLAAVLMVAGAMAARELSARVASSAALAISVLLVVLTVWYYRLYVYPPMSAGYGLFLGSAVAIAAALLSVWAMVAAWASTGRRP